MLETKAEITHCKITCAS